jgi:RNA polymerase sigma-70 factor, ECF subfamily
MLTGAEGHRPVRREGADDDFSAWYAAAWPRVVRAVAVYLGDQADAADIAADASARTLARWAGDDRPVDPTTWTIVVAINLAKRRGRREERGRALTATAAAVTSPADLGATDLDVWAAVAQLPPREREAVALRYGSDLTEPAVAEAMGITPGAVAATLHRARTKLRTLLGETHHG